MPLGVMLPEIVVLTGKEEVFVAVVMSEAKENVEYINNIRLLFPLRYSTVATSPPFPVSYLLRLGLAGILLQT